MPQPYSLPLPDYDCERWTPGRKLAVVQAVDDGRLTRERACEKYGIEPGELLTWINRAHQHGMLGLKEHRLQDVRRLERAQ